MANYNNLKATINANIKANGNEEITGPILNTVLNQAVTTLGDGWSYKGIATPSMSPGTPDSNVFYIATTAGTYTNFGSLVVAEGEVAILKYNGSWAKEVTGAATAAQVTQLGQEVYGETTEETISPSIVESGKALRTSGAVDTVSSYTTVVGKFNIKPNAKYLVSGRVGTGANACLVCFYNASDVFIAGSAHCPTTGVATPYLDYEVTAPANAAIMRVCGNSSFDYAPSIKEIIQGESLSDGIKRLSAEVEGEETNISPDRTFEKYCQLDKNTGEVFESPSATGSVYDFNIVGGSTIKVSGRVGTNIDACLGAFFDKDGSFISSFCPSIGVGTPYLDYEIVAPNNATMVRVAGNTNQDAPYPPAVFGRKGGITKEVERLDKLSAFEPAFDVLAIPTTTLPFFISSSTLLWQQPYDSSLKESCAIIKVTKGQRLQFVANDTKNCRYAFLSDYRNAANGESPDFLAGYSGTILVLSGTTELITVPADCYLYVFLRSYNNEDGRFEPKHIYIEGHNFFKGLKSIWQGPSVMQGVGCMFQNNRFSDRVAQYLGMTCTNYAITGSTVGKKPGSYERAFVTLAEWQSAVSGGQVDTSKTYLVKDNGSADFPWAIYSYSGGTWVAGARTPAGAQRTPIVDRIAEMATDADVVLVQGGTNDFQYNWDELGDDWGTAITTVKGAMRAICDFLVNTYPKKLIVWLTSLTPYRYQGGNTTPYSKNSLGYSGWDSHDAEMEVCEAYGIPVIDLGAEIGISPENPWWSDFDSAGTRVHPNDEAHRIAASCLAKKLLTMMESL